MCLFVNGYISVAPIETGLINKSYEEEQRIVGFNSENSVLVTDNY